MTLRSPAKRRGKPSAPEEKPGAQVKAFRWTGTSLLVLDQRALPHKVRRIECRTHRQVAACIRDMAVRGAPAIGCAAAYGMALAARERRFSTLKALRRHLDSARKTLGATRPTAVNLFWALERMARTASDAAGGAGWAKTVPAALEKEARRIEADDLASCLKIGELGADLLPSRAVVLTHCNAGALATAGHGTALGVVRSAHRRGKILKVFVDETRPFLQGARLTAWECSVDGIPYELVTDNMAGHLIKTEGVAAVVVGADRIAANGDSANKVGTYALAVLAKHHNVPFYVAAPYSTIDFSTPSGEKIPLEERSPAEVLSFAGRPVAPKGAKARHPAFDVTPAALITAIITERGVLHPPFAQSLVGSRPEA